MRIAAPRLRLAAIVLLLAVTSSCKTLRYSVERRNDGTYTLWKEQSCYGAKRVPSDALGHYELDSNLRGRLVYTNGVKQVGQFEAHRLDSGELFGLSPVGEIRIEDGRGNFAIWSVPDKRYVRLHTAGGADFYGFVMDRGEPATTNSVPRPKFFGIGRGRFVRPDGSALVGEFSDAGHVWWDLAGVAEADSASLDPSSRMEGPGQLFAPNGTSFAGTFVHGVPDGEGVCNTGGVASLCQMQRGHDVTERLISDEASKTKVTTALASVDEVFFRDVNAAQHDADRIESMLRAARDDAAHLDGPDHDDTCYCAFHNCLSLKRADEPDDPSDNLIYSSAEDVCANPDVYSAHDCEWATKRERERAEYKSECRRQWSKWLNLSPAQLQEERERLKKRRGELLQQEVAAGKRVTEEKARAAAKQAELDAAHQRVLADEKSMQEFYEKEQARIREERARKLDNLRLKCQSKPESCDCAIFQIKPGPSRDHDGIGACQA